ncbi:MAG: prepilin-type N-terminal cleavage/methylation domain-containing protein [Actinomycetes bacterium]
MRFRTHLRRAGDQGLTLVELLVAITLLAVISAISTAALVSAHNEFRASQDEAAGLTDTQTVVERLGRDIRDARGVDPGATQGTLSLWIDNNSDYIRNAATQPDEIVTWSLASKGSGSTQYNTLRNTAGGTAVVQSRTLVSNLAFCYRVSAPPLDPSDTTTGCLTTPLSASDAALVKYVTVKLQYDATVGSGTTARTATFSERLRNVT